MGYPAYSTLLCKGDSISSPTALGGPPDGYLWVVRAGFMTHGSFAGFVRGAISVGSEGPWLWLWATSTGQLLGVVHGTEYWEGRLVIPPGNQIWAQVASGDTCDFLMSGYQLSSAG